MIRRINSKGALFRAVVLPGERTIVPEVFLECIKNGFVQGKGLVRGRVVRQTVTHVIAVHLAEKIAVTVLREKLLYFETTY